MYVRVKHYTVEVKLVLGWCPARIRESAQLNHNQATHSDPHRALY